MNFHNYIEYTMIDLIGDIHGHADKLEELLIKLGYNKKDGVYAHPERKVLFIGDYIDRGPKIPETLHIVKSMVDRGNAIALMGNHEYNAICFALEDLSGGHVRKHLIKNIIQHTETLKQFQNRQSEYDSYLEWFKTLPLFFENDDFRATHACWDPRNIEYLNTILLGGTRLNDDLIRKSAIANSPLNIAIDQTLKGKEISLPRGESFLDKDGTERREIRIKWWEDPREMTYKSISVISQDNIPDHPINLSDAAPKYYDASEKIVFFGHYWLTGEPSVYRDNICCLDFSVAKQGKLVCYRYDGEKKLSNEKLVFV